MGKQQDTDIAHVSLPSGRARILCVDDDPDLLLINSSALRMAGHEVFEASSGGEGLNIARRTRPDLILSDVMLPDIKGFELCRSVKEDPELRGTYVILISGMQTSSESQIRGFETGADGYIVRPLSVQELVTRVHAMLRIKQTEAALRRSMEQYQTLVETMNEGLAVLDDEGLFSFVNSKFCDMLGRPKHEILGRRPAEFLYASDRLKAEENWSMSLSAASDPYEAGWIRKDGHPIYTLVSPRTVRDEQRNITGLLIVMTDITDRIKAEATVQRLNEELEQRVADRTRQLEAVVEELEGEIIERKRIEHVLKENEEKLLAITNTATDAIILIDDEGKIAYWNPAAEKIFGYSKYEALGRELHLFLASEDYHEAYRQGFRQFVCNGEGSAMGKTLEFLALKKDGTRFPIEISKSVLNVRGKYEAVGIIRDITQRKLDEKTLLRYAERLQSLSKRLIEVQEEERRFIAQELHDEVGQSLTALKLFIDNLISFGEPQMKDKLGEIQGLIQEILTRTRNMSLDLRPSMLDDFGLLPALFWHFDRYRQQTNVRVNFKHTGLQTRFNPEIETAVYRIVQEALTNVARHARVNEVSVALTAQSDKIELVVEDKGSGFDYEKVRNALRTAGIKWMRERLVLLGGHLDVSSSSPGGTKLTARIPIGWTNGSREE